MYEALISHAPVVHHVLSNKTRLNFAPTNAPMTSHNVLVFASNNCNRRSCRIRIGRSLRGIHSSFVSVVDLFTLAQLPHPSHISVLFPLRVAASAAQPRLNQSVFLRLNHTSRGQSHYVIMLEKRRHF